MGCDSSLPVACRNLAEYRLEGKDGNKDVGAALNLYKKACNAKDGKSCNQVGLMYYPKSRIISTQNNSTKQI